MKKRILGVLLGVVMVASLVACGGAKQEEAAPAEEPAAEEAVEEEAAPAEEEAPAEEAAAEEAPAEEAAEAPAEGGKTAADYKIAVIPKMTDLAWFERMEQGVTAYNEEHGCNVEYTGSAKGEDQAAYIENLVSQGYDAICIVPFDVEAVDPVLAKFRDAGTVVICHEASSATNMDYDIEAFDTFEFGAHLMKALGELTGGEGTYIETVATLESVSHNEEAQGGMDYAAENLPNLKMGNNGDKILSQDNEDEAYNRVKEALTADPSINAIQCAAMSETPGAARAIRELGLTDQVKIAGVSLNSVCKDYVVGGEVDLMSFWDPAEAAKAMIELAVATLNGEAGGELSLDVPGYEKLKLDGNVYVGSAWIDVTKENVDDPAYDF